MVFNSHGLCIINVLVGEYKVSYTSIKVIVNFATSNEHIKLLLNLLNCQVALYVDGNHLRITADHQVRAIILNASSHGHVGPLTGLDVSHVCFQFVALLLAVTHHLSRGREVALEGLRHSDCVL